MTDNNYKHVSHSILPDGEMVDVTEHGKKIIAMDPRKTLIDYSGLNFKEMLMACPIDDLDLTREPEYPRDMEL
ncbi:MAG: hypothetical protein F4X64_05290 [Chloroflexi bacterium]|nr:hypothetical protein [Chloroflexota bacterium]